MNANRRVGYVIRFYKESDETAYFYRQYYSNDHALHREVDRAKIFETEEEAAKKITEIKKVIKKKYKRGYLYLSKVFHGDRQKPKLTKPDMHDFVHNL